MADMGIPVYGGGGGFAPTTKGSVFRFGSYTGSAPSLTDVVIGQAIQWQTIVAATSWTVPGMVVATDERAVIVCTARATAARTLGAVTIGGQPMVELLPVFQAGANHVTIYIGPVGVGGDIILPWSASQARGQVTFWACKNIGNSVVSAIGTVSGEGGTVTLVNIPAGGAVFAGASANPSAQSVPAYDWTGVTEATDITIAGNVTSAACIVLPSGGTDVIVANFTAGTDGVLGAIAIR